MKFPSIWFCLGWTAALPLIVSGQEYNDYSSFISANASLAVVVDHDYMREHNVDIISHFRKILGDTIREHLRNGGLNVKYFTWNGVRLKKGECYGA